MEYLVDDQLIHAIKQGDSAAFDILFDRYWEKLYRNGLSRLRDADHVQDIIQEIFINIWERRESLQIKTSIEQYLNGALKFSIISHFRSQKLKDAQLDEALQRIELLEHSIHDLSDYLLLEQTLAHAVDTMPEMLKQVYLLRSDNYSIKEIAGKLGIAEQTVKNYTAEVLRRLRIILAKKYPEGYLLYITLLLSSLHN